jgi:hypothetical protein
MNYGFGFNPSPTLPSEGDGEIHYLKEMRRVISPLMDGFDFRVVMTSEGVPVRNSSWSLVSSRAITTLQSGRYLLIVVRVFRIL